MKPLYLQGSDLRVQLDGPALRVSKDCRADRWFPLQRISRIISNQSVNWSTGALIACAQTGVTVSFLDPDGKLLARVLGTKAESESLAMRLQNAMLRPDWQANYRTWLDAMHRMAIRSLIRRAGVEFDCVPSARQLRQMFYQEASRMQALASSKKIGQQIQSLLSSLNRRELHQLKAELSALIHPRQDDIRFYPLESNPQQICLGVQALPEGIYLLESGVTLNIC